MSQLAIMLPFGRSLSISGSVPINVPQKPNAGDRLEHHVEQARYNPTTPATAWACGDPRQVPQPQEPIELKSRIIPKRKVFASLFFCPIQLKVIL